MIGPRIYGFKEACAAFDGGLLQPLERLVATDPFLAMYVATALVETLAGAHLAPNVRCNGQAYKLFVRGIPDYDRLENVGGVLYSLPSAIYHVVRCGILHGSRLDTATATPPKLEKVLPVRIHDRMSLPTVDANEWHIGAPHFVRRLRDAFSTFRVSFDPDRRTNFPQRFEINVTTKTIMSVDPYGGISTLTQHLSGGP
jgi:hypothetical protein